MNELDAGPLFRFSDWPNDQVPRRTLGVYAIWRGGELIYVGIGGSGGGQLEDFAVKARLELVKLHTALAQVAATVPGSDSRTWFEVAGFELGG